MEETLRAALAEMEPLHQEVLLLRLVQGCKHREVALRLGISVGQASGIIARGLVRLAGRLAPFLPEDAG